MPELHIVDYPLNAIDKVARPLSKAPEIGIISTHKTCVRSAVARKTP